MADSPSDDSSRGFAALSLAGAVQTRAGAISTAAGVALVGGLFSAASETSQVSAPSSQLRIDTGALSTGGFGSEGEQGMIDTEFVSLNVKYICRAAVNSRSRSDGRARFCGKEECNIHTSKNRQLVEVARNALHIRAPTSNNKHAVSV
jgi:hypothetical protein